MSKISDSVIRAAQKINRIVASKARPHGITVRQVDIIIALADYPGASQTELMSYCSMDRTTISYLMLGMEKKGLVVRKKNKDDIRAFEVSLTVKGEGLIKSAKRLRHEVEETLTKAMAQPTKTGIDLEAIAEIPVPKEKKKNETT